MPVAERRWWGCDPQRLNRKSSSASCASVELACELAWWNAAGCYAESAEQLELPARLR